jgi:2,4-didehydro-3-deoxy-L-rhamnonate hydrolase
MKLVRYGQAGREKPGLIDAQGKLRDLSGVLKDIGPDQLGDAALTKLRKLKLDKLPLVRGKPRMGCPVNGIGKFIAIGLNAHPQGAGGLYQGHQLHPGAG